MNDAFNYIAIDDYFLDFVANQEKYSRENLKVPNHDVYERRLTHSDFRKYKQFRLTPHSMYFYYVRINRDGRFVIDHYFYVDGDINNTKTWKEIPHDEKGLTKLVRTLAINARPRVKPSEKNPPRRTNGDFKNSPWNHISYVAIFFDEANWMLRKKKVQGKPRSPESAVTFIVKEGSKKGTPNHSFFDAIDLKIMMPFTKPKPDGTTEDERSAIVFVNHMKVDEDGNDLDTKKDQNFEFKMLLDVKSVSAEHPPTVFIIDPGGTNGGPTVPPPP